MSISHLLGELLRKLDCLEDEAGQVFRFKGIVKVENQKPGGCSCGQSSGCGCGRPSICNCNKPPVRPNPPRRDKELECECECRCREVNHHHGRKD